MEAVQGCIRCGGGGAVWQNVGERRYTQKQKPRMGTEEVGKAVVEKREAWKMIEGFSDRGEQEEGRQDGGGLSREQYGGRTVPKA